MSLPVRVEQRLTNLVVLALLVLGCALALARPATAQLQFSPTVNVSNTPGETRQPHMAVDSSGTLHVAYADVAGGPHRILYRRSFDHGQSFTSPIQVSTGIGAALRPRLAVHGGAVYLVWHQDPDTAQESDTKEIMFSRSLDGGASFSSPVNLSNTPANSFEGRIAVGPNGTLYVVWDELFPSSHLAFTRSFDGGGSWETPRSLIGTSLVRNCAPTEPTGSCTVYPGIAVDRNSGNVYVTWHDLVGGRAQVLFMRSTDGGGAFSAPLQLSNAPSPLHAHCASISVGPTGKILVAYEDRKQIDPHRHDAKFVQSFDGGLSFTSPINLSNGPSWAFSDYPWPTESRNGTIVVGWEDNTVGGDLDAVVGVSTDGGASFSPHTNLSDNPDSTSTEVVTLFADDGHLYVLWEDHATGNGDIYLRVAFEPVTTPGPQRGETDFDADGRADVAVYRSSTGEWFIRRSADGGVTQVTWGAPSLGDIPVPAQYSMFGRADIAVYRRSSGEWFIRRSTDGGLTQIGWGSAALDDIPAPADFDGDGLADIAVYRRSTGEWLIRRSGDGGLTQMGWGAPSLGDVPVPADFDGDGRADIAVYRRANGEWFIQRSSDGGLTQTGWGAPSLGDVPVPADFDGDGRADIAVYRGASGEWFIQRSSDGGLTHVGWGAPSLGDVPVPADFDGDGRADIAVFRRATGEWFIRRSSDGGLTTMPWGAPSLGDVPLPQNGAMR